MRRDESAADAANGERAVHEAGLFVQLARHYFDEEVIRARIGEILDREAEIMQALPLRAAVH